MEKRWSTHLQRVRGEDDNVHFYNAIRLYGEVDWSHEILEDDLTPGEALIREVELIAKFNTFRNGYNSTQGGDGVLGLKHSDLSRKKMSNSHSGKVLSQEHRDKIGLAHRGRKNSPEVIAKMKKAHTGKKLSEDHRARISTSENRKQVYLVIDSEGSEEIVKNLKAFCNRTNLNYTHMCRLANNDPHRKQHKGYTCKKIMRKD